MSEQVLENPTETRKAALQALGAMGAALFVGTLVWQEGPRALLWIFAFCLSLMTLVSTVLFVFEARVCRDSPDPTIGFCRPAIGILGFSTGLFFAAGFWLSAGLAVAFAAYLAAYRHRAVAGDFNLIPQAARDVGMIGGIGVALSGMFLVVVNLIAGPQPV
ncbi:MAG: hypothetical protein ACU0GG_19785 [Paracoccaceae bacterium]